MRRLLISLFMLFTLSCASAQDTSDSCPDDLSTHISTDNFARVTPGGGANRVRSEPTTNATALGRIPESGIFWVSDGPVCADGYTWWYAEYRGLNGWTAEGTDDEDWLEPVSDEDAPILNIDGLSEVIVFESKESLDSRIDVIDLNGAVSVILTPPNFRDIELTVSPDFAHLAFLTYDETERRYYPIVMGFDGSFRRRLDDAIFSSMAWSPDSENLVVNLEEADPDSEVLSLYSNLYLIAAGGGERRALTSGLVNHSPASWSPDGTQIAYTIDGYNQTSSLWMMDMTSREERQILSMEANLGTPQWSPDGTAIAVRAVLPNSDYQYFVVNPDGSNLRQPTGDGQMTDEFAWSPDGTRIAFAAYRDGDSDIYIVNADGTGLIELTNNDTCEIRPSWSPDGQSIVFVSNRDRERQNLCAGDVYVMDADGNNVRRLTDNGRDNQNPQWITITPPLPPE
jgi:Tol biopolymer transport system component